MDDSAGVDFDDVAGVQATLGVDRLGGAGRIFVVEGSVCRAVGAGAGGDALS